MVIICIFLVKQLWWATFSWSSYGALTYTAWYVSESNVEEEPGECTLTFQWALNQTSPNIIKILWLLLLPFHRSTLERPRSHIVWSKYLFCTLNAVQQPQLTLMSLKVPSYWIKKYIIFSFLSVMSRKHVNKYWQKCNCLLFIYKRRCWIWHALCGSQSVGNKHSTPCSSEEPNKSLWYFLIPKQVVEVEGGERSVGGANRGQLRADCCNWAERCHTLTPLNMPHFKVVRDLTNLWSWFQFKIRTYWTSLLV